MCRLLVADICCWQHKHPGGRSAQIKQMAFHVCLCKAYLRRERRVLSLMQYANKDSFCGIGSDLAIKMSSYLCVLALLQTCEFDTR